MKPSLAAQKCRIPVSKFLGCLLCLIFAATATASTEGGAATLVKDINTIVRSSIFFAERAQPVSLAQVGAFLYFPADDGIHGTELWKTDGTAEGTMMVRDINAGRSSSSPRPLANVNGTLFFQASDGIHGMELWKTDGTEEGTVMVLDLTPGTNDSYPSHLCETADGVFFFHAAGGLWRSDGTEAGTEFLAEGGINAIAADGAGIVFLMGQELWKSDGSVAGTIRLAQFHVFNGAVFNLIPVENKWLFTFRNSTSVELWKTDATVDGTVLVKTINPTGNHVPRHFTAVGNILYFRASGDENGSLWKSDGTEEGTVRIKEMNDSEPGAIVTVGSTLFFGGSEGLWKSDGTEAGTVLVSPLVPVEPGGKTPRPSITALGETIFFTTNGPAGGPELWKSDGTEAGTVLVKDIFPGESGSTPASLTAAFGKLFFSANDGLAGRELWSSDGTESGTVRLININQATASSGPGSLTTVGETLFFSAYDGVDSSGGLWRTDGTEPGTVQVPIGDGDPISEMIQVGESIFFSRRNTLWKSDGTEQGTTMVKKIGTHQFFNVQHFAEAGGILYFKADDDVHGQELWKSDGTAEGTVLVKDIFPGSAGSLPHGLAEFQGMVYFQASDGVHGFELWRSDGSSEGTQRVKGAGTSGYGPRHLVEAGGFLFFTAHDDVHGTELWRSDGTGEGTVIIKDINPGSAASFPTELTAVDDTLFFLALDRLWKSDGSPEGTVPVKTIAADHLTDIHGTLFFTANATEGGFELWKSDGTEAGTEMVMVIDGIFDPVSLRSVGRDLFFAGNRADVGRELFVISLDNEIPPQLMIVPSGQFATSGDAVIISVAAEGGDLQYQWFHNGTLLEGATAAMLTIDPVTPDHGGTYTIVVTNPAGSLEAMLQLTIDPQPPAITQLTREGEGLGLHFEAKTPGRYRVEASTDLIHWILLEEITVESSMEIIPFVDEGAFARATRFYRVLLLP